MTDMGELLRRGCELLAIWTLYLATFWNRGVRHDFRLLKAKMRWSILALISFFVVASLAQCFTFNIYNYPQRSDFFPFARWAMFAEPNAQKDNPRIYLYDFQGITTDGHEVYLNPARLFFSPNAITLFSKAHTLGDGVDHGAPEQRARSVQLLRYYMDGLKKRYEAAHPGEQLIEIALWRRTVAMKRGVAPAIPFREPESVRLSRAEYSPR